MESIASCLDHRVSRESESGKRGTDCGFRARKSLEPNMDLIFCC